MSLPHDSYMEAPLDSARMPKKAHSGVTIIGPGRLGQALGKLLSRSGVAIESVAARRIDAARRAVRFIGAGHPASVDDPKVAQASTILITASDAAIRPVAERLAEMRADWSGSIVLHTCGSLAATGPKSVLRGLKRRGAATGLLHPFQTIPSPEAGVRSLAGCYWNVEGEPAALKLALRWVKALEGLAFHVRPERRTLYHAAAVLSCPTAVTLMDGSERLLKLSGVPERVVRPMLAAFGSETARSFGAVGARRALTGPAARGDFDTLARHLRALRRHAPDLVPAYSALVRAMLKLAGRRAPRGLL